MCPPCLGAAPPSPSTCVAVPRSGAGVAGHSRCLHSVLRLQSTHTGTAGAASVGYGGRCQCPDSCTPSQGAAACRVEHRQQRIMPQSKQRQWRSERPWEEKSANMVSVYGYICFATWFRTYVSLHGQRFSLHGNLLSLRVHAATRPLFYLHIQRTHMMAQTSIFKGAFRNCSRVPP